MLGTCPLACLRSVQSKHLEQTWTNSQYSRIKVSNASRSSATMCRMQNLNPNTNQKCTRHQKAFKTTKEDDNRKPEGRLSPLLRTKMIGRKGRESRVVGAMAASIKRTVVRAA